MVKGIEAVAVGLVVFILAQKLIATLITGTDTGSVIRRIVTLRGDSHRITHQIRGKLNSAMSKPITELNQRMNLGNCGETRWWGSETRINYRSWNSPIRLERASQILYPDLSSLTDRIRRNVKKHCAFIQ